MQPTITRRRFLDVAGRTMASASALALAPAAIAADGKPAWAVTCRDIHLKVTGEKDCWSALKALGAEGVEANMDEDLSLPGLFGEAKYLLSTEAGIEKVRADAAGAGRRITALCLNNRFDERPEMEVVWSAKAARAAKALGVKAIRIDIWPHKLKGEEFLKFTIEEMKKIIAETEDTGVSFGIENHGDTTNDPRFLTALFDAVGSKRLGLTLDTGNFYWYGHPLSKVHQIFETFASRVVHTHVKSIRYPEAEREKQRPRGWEYDKYNCPIDQGDVDFRRLAKALRAAGYANDLCVEDESLGKFPAAERAAVVAREIRFLKDLQA